MTASDKAPPPSVAETFIAWQTRTVEMLLVDDDRAFRRVVSEYISGSRYNVHIDEASTFDAAFALARSKNYDVAMIDLKLASQRDGIELIRALIALPVEEPISLCLISGHMEPHLYDRALDAAGGVLDFARKGDLGYKFFHRLFGQFSLARRAGFRPPAQSPAGGMGNPP